MADILIQAPDLGLNALLPINMLNPREAADGSYNVYYEKGVLRTADGISNWATSAALNSGDMVLGVFTPRILLSDYMLAVTREKIYRRDFTNTEWDDITQAGVTMNSSADYPISVVVISHDDADIYYNDDPTGTPAYEHVVICDGGRSNIQRWAGEGEADCADLLGSDGYSTGTTHRALHVGTTQNRLILISPQEYDASGKVWVENRNRVRWPQIGKLQSWTGTGSGAVDLRDTGGINVLSGALGGEFYVYQDNSIWNLRYVGGTTVFDPKPVIHDLGLLSHHLLVPHGNVHYFIGSDYNVWAFYGGTIKKPIGDKIRDYLYRDIETDFLRRCWIGLDVNAERLGVFIVPNGYDYASVVYWYDPFQGNWSKQDLTENFPTGGITAVSLIGTVTGTKGETYRTALSQLSPYDVSDAADATLRYGDVLRDSSRTLTSEVSNGSWCAGGTYFTCATGALLSDLTVNDIVRVEDGSAYTNCRYGTHYYTVTDLSNTYITLAERDSSCAVSDDPEAVPASVPFTAWAPTGSSYAQNLEVYETEKKMVLGDDSGFLYVFDPSGSGTYDATTFSCLHLTPVFDAGTPGRQKRWPGLRVTARKPETTNDGQLLVYYRTADFDSTATSSWTRIDATWSLDGTWATKEFWINRTASKIQFALMDVSGTTFEVSEIEILEPELEENR